MNRTNRPLWPDEPRILTDEEQETAHAAFANWGPDKPPTASTLPGESAMTCFISAVLAVLLTWLGWALLATYWDKILLTLRGWAS